MKNEADGVAAAEAEVQAARDAFQVAYASPGGNHPAKGSKERKLLLDKLRRALRRAEERLKKVKSGAADVARIKEAW